MRQRQEKRRKEGEKDCAWKKQTAIIYSNQPSSLKLSNLTCVPPSPNTPSKYTKKKGRGANREKENTTLKKTYPEVGDHAKIGQLSQVTKRELRSFIPEHVCDQHHRRVQKQYKPDRK